MFDFYVDQKIHTIIYLFNTYTVLKHLTGFFLLTLENRAWQA